MKALSLLLLVALGWALNGCADPLEQRDTSEVRGQIQRGVTGQGQLTPVDRPESDPAGEHSVPQTHP
jgi:hypothetical protein